MWIGGPVLLAFSIKMWLLRNAAQLGYLEPEYERDDESGKEIKMGVRKCSLLIITIFFLSTTSPF